MNEFSNFVEGELGPSDKCPDKGENIETK